MVFFLPYVTPFIASAAVFKQLFAMRDTSPVNMVLRTLGSEAQMWLQEFKGIFEILAKAAAFTIPEWAAGPSLALCVIIIHSIWTYVGYDVVIYLAGLGNISTEIKEAAEIDGANRWDVFRHITFPLLSPTTYFLSLIAIIGTFKAFPPCGSSARAWHWARPTPSAWSSSPNSLRSRNTAMPLRWPSFCSLIILTLTSQQPGSRIQGVLWITKSESFSLTASTTRQITHLPGPLRRRVYFPGALCLDDLHLVEEPA